MAATAISPKVTAASLGAAIATIVWIVVGALTDAFSEEAIAALTGATSTILAFVLGYLVRDPARG